MCGFFVFLESHGLPEKKLALTRRSFLGEKMRPPYVFPPGEQSMPLFICLFHGHGLIVGPLCARTPTVCWTEDPRPCLLG